MYPIKRNWLRFNCPQRTSLDYYKVTYAMPYHRAKENVKEFFPA